MANGTKIVEGIRRTKLAAAEITLFKQSFVLVPYQPSGFLDFTNRGYSTGPINPNDFETFKRVWSGNDAFTINWKGSCNLSQSPETKQMKLSFSLGEVILGFLTTNESQTEIKQDESFSQYKSQQIKDRLVFKISTHFDITDYYQFLFWKIPEISGSTVYRVESLTKEYQGLELVGYVLTLESLNQELANTGRARQQNITPNSPGQGYLECIVKDSSWPKSMTPEEWEKLVEGRDYYSLFDRYITADFQKTLNNPCKKVIIKGLGVGTHSTFVASGRPVMLGDSLDTYRPQRLIFPINLTEPSSPTLWRAQNTSNNFYWCSLIPTLLYFKDLMQQIKDSLTPINEWKYQGFLLYDAYETKNTNPIVSGSYKYNLYGYLDQTVFPNIEVPWDFHTPNKTVRTSGVYGCEQAYLIGGQKKIHDHMFDAFWTQKAYKALPIEKKNTLSFGSTIMSGLSMVGSGLFQMNGWQLGLGTVLSVIGFVGANVSKYRNKNIDYFYSFIDASLLDFNESLFGNDSSDIDKKLPFNLLDTNSSSSPSTIFFDGSTMQFGYQAKLTDLFTCGRVPGKILSTYNIGQTTYEDGTNIFPNGQALKMNGDSFLLNSYDLTSGYIIDSFKICGIFNGEYSIEFLDNNDEIIWHGVYQSEGKWTNSLREIWTEKNCSVFGRENVFYSEPIPYPKEVAPVIPDYPVAVDLEHNVNYSHGIVLLYPGGGTTFYNGSWVRNDFGGFQTFSSKEFIGQIDLLGRDVDEAELLTSYSHVEFRFISSEPQRNKLYIVNVPILTLLTNPGQEMEIRQRVYEGSSKHFYFLVALILPQLFTNSCYIECEYKNIIVKYENKRLVVNIPKQPTDRMHVNNWTITGGGIIPVEMKDLDGYYILNAEYNNSCYISFEKITLKAK